MSNLQDVFVRSQKNRIRKWFRRTPPPWPGGPLVTPEELAEEDPPALPWRPRCRWHDSDGVPVPINDDRTAPIDTSCPEQRMLREKCRAADPDDATRRVVRL